MSYEEFRVGDEVEICYRDYPDHTVNGFTAEIKKIVAAGLVEGPILELDRSDWHIRYRDKMPYEYHTHSIWAHSVRLVQKSSNIPEPLDSDLI